MTDHDLRELAADTLRGISELRESQRESQRESGRLLAEVGQRPDRLAEASARDAASLRESQRVTDRQVRETDRQVKELGRQLGGLGEKFGSFTEGMAFPSMKKILRERFGADHVTLRSLVRLNGRSHEVDVLAYANGDRGAVYVVEVKSHLREDGLEQMLRLLREFPQFYPEHRGKRLYGILAAVDMAGDLREKVLREGIYLAQISGDTFTLQVPESFAPRTFQQPLPAP